MLVQNRDSDCSDIAAKRQYGGGESIPGANNDAGNGVSDEGNGTDDLVNKTENLALNEGEIGEDPVKGSQDQLHSDKQYETTKHDNKFNNFEGYMRDHGRVGDVLSKGSGSEKFLQSLNNCLFKETGDQADNFPLKICVGEGHKDEANECIGDDTFKFTRELEISFTNKGDADRVVTKLLDCGIEVTFTYADFISHPGNLFIKNLSDELINYDALFEYFQKKSRYHSLVDINIFNSVEDDIFAILKFLNYLDVDHILKNLDASKNPFNVNENVPIYLNKYISKKERKLKYTENSAASENINNYNTIVIENLSDFLNSYNPDMSTIETFLSKFEIFNKIESIYFPIIQTTDNNFNLLNFGFINFEINENLNINVLKCLYYLNDLSFTNFMKFGPDDAYNIEQDLCKPDLVPSTDHINLRVSIGQHKHNHYLYQCQTNQLLCLQNNKLFLKYLDIPYYNILLNTFSKFVNYQETNIYVNNLPVIFENDDRLWEEFWLQFGNCIKSAKIIKPQFYSKKNELELGKIGFVFYKDFKMALRAILLTNNKLISFGSFKKVFVQTSFAIQKNNHNHQRPSLPSNYYQAHNQSNKYSKRFSLPTITDYNYFLQPPSVPVPPPTAPAGNPSDYINFYNPYMYQFNYPYVPFDKDLSPNDDSNYPENISPPLNYYYQPYYQFPSSNNYQPLSTPPTSPVFKLKKTNKPKYN